MRNGFYAIRKGMKSHLIIDNVSLCGINLKNYQKCTETTLRTCGNCMRIMKANLKQKPEE